MTPQAPCLSKRQRYQPIALPQHVSAEEMARDWTLGAGDHQALVRYRQGSRLSMAIQLCAARLSGRFVNHGHEVAPPIMKDVGPPRAGPPSLTVEVPEREATSLEHRQHVRKP